MPNCRILLVEDDKEISRLTKMYLEAEGYEVDAICDGSDAVDAVKNIHPDLIILDLMLPGKDGATICQEVREFYDGMIVVLTASEDELTEVSLFKFGADDYLTKPVRGHILVARIEALLRRYKKSQPTTDPLSLSKYGITLCLTRKIACYHENKLNLTASEFDILHLLMENSDKPVSREIFCQSARGIEYNFNDRSIDMRVSGLRKKFSQANVSSAFIKTVRNQGYMLTHV
ncbi:response regulator transcription factor [Vibrio nigripulchritudo]|uniref:response regulator transcription factor n=1 Tax=Vibrio nigripulchritudo TaxID=28173 RepID=UPI0005F9DE3E|nr:response regulator transcription factor [Vibrio nigripulchritudo]KJY73563.1 chemotaxis protein CheY [Vibrio nigripulchritudo]